MKSFRELLSSEGPLILPGAHDALSARLMKQAGFEAYFIGGFQVVGARYGRPPKRKEDTLWAYEKNYLCP